jgi:cyclopropane fatty-acyl-phospholipid synthase-like methyltransferase
MERSFVMENKKSESAKYWEEHLLSWEAGAYYKEGPQNASWWDRLSSVFRGDAMYVRMQAALELVKPHIKGARVLDVGCASGRFAFQMLQAGAAKVYGTDISASASEMGKQRGAELGLQDRLEFSLADVVQPNMGLPQVDLVTALGVIEYFDAKDMSSFLGNLKTKYFLLDFPDVAKRREFPTWMLRQIYIRKNHLPGVYLYTLDEFARIAEPFGFKDLWVAKRNQFYYVTNLPKP